MHGRPLGAGLCFQPKDQGACDRRTPDDGGGGLPAGARMAAHGLADYAGPPQTGLSEQPGQPGFVIMLALSFPCAPAIMICQTHRAQNTPTKTPATTSLG